VYVPDPVAKFGNPSSFSLESFESSPRPARTKQPLDILQDVELDLRIELGRTEMLIEEVVALKEGSVVTLDKLAGDPVDILVNGRLIARGEVLVLNDNFCVRVAEILTPEG
jgi:flagellar motor switch protein FliN/FliY